MTSWQETLQPVEDRNGSPLSGLGPNSYAPQTSSPFNGFSDTRDGEKGEGKRTRRHEQFIILKKEVEASRDAVLRCRLDLRESRTALSRHRLKLRELESELLRQLHSRWEDKTAAGIDDMDEIYEDIVQISDRLGPQEEDYWEKEDDLNVMERKLGKLEDRLYNSSALVGLPSDSRATSTGSLSYASYRESPTSSLALEEPELSPMHRYLSRMGDANIVRERLGDLNFERLQYISQEEDRGALGVPLYQPNVDFLAAFDRVYGKHLSELHTIESDLAILEREAGLADLADFNGNGGANSESRLATTKSHDDQWARCVWYNEHTPRRKSDGDLFDIPNDLVSARQRINRWILERLIGSPIERARHKEYLDDPKLSDKEWLALISEYWYQDRAAIPSNTSPRHTSISTKPPENHRPRWSPISRHRDSLSEATCPVFSLNDGMQSNLRSTDFGPNKDEVNQPVFTSSPRLKPPKLSSFGSDHKGYVFPDMQLAIRPTNKSRHSV